MPVIAKVSFPDEAEFSCGPAQDVVLDLEEWFAYRDEDDMAAMRRVCAAVLAGRLETVSADLSLLGLDAQVARRAPGYITSWEVAVGVWPPDGRSVRWADGSVECRRHPHPVALGGPPLRSGWVLDSCEVCAVCRCDVCQQEG
jgi:hypothetical protein